MHQVLKARACRLAWLMRLSRMQEPPCLLPAMQTSRRLEECCADHGSACKITVQGCKSSPRQAATLAVAPQAPRVHAAKRAQRRTGLGLGLGAFTD